MSIGVGIGTARYGHHATFLDAQLQHAAPALAFTESQEGYAKLRQALEELRRKHPQVQFQIHIDAAGHYAANLERFVRDLPLPKTVSFGEPARNSHYRKAHYPKGKSDPIDSKAMSRFAIVEQPAPAAEVPEAFYQLREVAGRLEALIRQHTRLVNQLHNLMSRVFPELAVYVNNLASNYVLKLLHAYRTPEKIARARLSSLKAIPHFKPEMAEKIHAAAKQSVASLRGRVGDQPPLRPRAFPLGRGRSGQEAPPKRNGRGPQPGRTRKASGHRSHFQSRRRLAGGQSTVARGKFAAKRSSSAAWHDRLRPIASAGDNGAGVVALGLSR
jgi:hypothetical protein